MTAAPSSIEIRPVESKAERNAFIRVPFGLQQGDPNWIAPLIIERQQHFDTNKNPYFEHARAKLWMAFKDGRPAGRISAQICDLYLERYGDQTGHFGFIEAADDADVFKALVETACGWLAGNGMKRVIGPFSFSINDECGLLVDGFDTPPCLMMNHAPPYYGERLEEQGFAKVKDMYAYDYGRELELPRALASMVERARKAGDLELRPVNMSKLDEDLAIIIDIFNDAWADNWGFVPMTHGEVKALGDNLKLLVTGDYAAIASYKGEPAAMAVTLPNVNDAIADLNGRLLPFGWAKLLWRLKMRPPTSVRMPLMGLRKAYQGRTIGAALAAAVIDATRGYHHGRGTLRGELSWVLEDNEAIRNMIGFVGAKQYKTYRIYERALEAGGRG